MSDQLPNPYEALKRIAVDPRPLVADASLVATAALAICDAIRESGTPVQHEEASRAPRPATPQSDMGQIGGGRPPVSEPENPPDGWRMWMLGFGKHKAETWGHMAEGSMDGERYNYLAWLRDQITEDLREHPDKPYADMDRAKLTLARAAMAEIEARHDAGLPPPVERNEPVQPPLADSDVPF
jgi:hypothetical protein